MESPIHVIARYEEDLIKRLGVARGDRPSLNKIFGGSVHFQKLERGEYRDFKVNLL